MGLLYLSLNLTTLRTKSSPQASAKVGLLLVYSKEHNAFFHDELIVTGFQNNFSYRADGTLQRRNFSINVVAQPFTLSQDTFIVQTQKKKFPSS